MMSSGVSRVFSKDEKESMYRNEGIRISRETSQASELKLYDFCKDFENFIKNHSKIIKSNKIIYDKIKNMCKQLDVDSSYYLDGRRRTNKKDRIGERIIDICRILRRQNTNLVDVQYCLQLLKPRYPDVTADDIIASIYDLSILGTIELQQYGPRYVISSMTNTHEGILSCLEIIYNDNHGKIPINISDLTRKLNWNEYSAINCLELLISNGYVWIDMTLTGNKLDVYYKLVNNNRLTDLNDYYEDIYLYTLT